MVGGVVGGKDFPDNVLPSLTGIGFRLAASRISSLKNKVNAFYCTVR